MSKVKNVLISVLIAAVISLGAIGCSNDDEHPTGDHPANEETAKKAAAEEHPAGEHPTEEGKSEEHPAGEHPKK